MKEQGRLKGQVAIVTGSARGIGKAIALRFAREGACVVVQDLKEVEANEVVREIREDLGTESIFIKGDISLEGDIKNIVEKTISEFGRIDILVNNAGISLMRKIPEATVADWDRLNNVNLRGVWLCIREIVPHMMKQKYGKIVNIASVSGLVGYKWESIYCATKGGVINMTRELAVELCEHNINVNCICPGITDTPIYLEVNYPLDDPKNLEETLRAIPAKRIGKPEDIAGAAFFLVSEDASYVMGQILAVDGGYTAI